MAGKRWSEVKRGLFVFYENFEQAVVQLAWEQHRMVQRAWAGPQFKSHLYQTE